MGIIEELSKMKTKTEQKQIDEERLSKQEKKLREKENERQIKEKQQKILNLLNDDNPELDEPYPYVEKRTRNLITGRKYELKPIADMQIKRAELMVELGIITGKQETIFFSNKVVTKREMLLRELLGYDKRSYLAREGKEILVSEEGYGQLDSHEESKFEKVTLGKEDAKEYEDLIPESVKEEIELRRRKIEIIKNKKSLEMTKRGYLVPYSTFKNEFAVRTSLRRALLALGEEEVEEYFLNSNRFKQKIGLEIPCRRDAILKSVGIISKDSIKKAIENRMRGER